MSSYNLYVLYDNNLYNIKSSEFENMVRYWYYTNEHAVLNTHSFQEFKKHVLAIVAETGDEVRIANRCQELDGTIYYGLSREKTALITEDGYSIKPSHECPIIFNFGHNALELSEPQETADPKAVRDRVKEIFNLTDDQYVILVDSMLMMMADLDHYILLEIIGSAGSGKSFLATCIQDIVDPIKTPLLGLPNNRTDYFSVATKQHLLTFDNVSNKATESEGDLFCQGLTGADHAKRALFSDDDLHAAHTINPIVITTIDEWAARSDLLDRAIILRLNPLPKNGRRTKRELLKEWNEIKPQLLDMLFNALSLTLRRTNGVEVPEVRFIDAATTAAKGNPALGIDHEAFMRVFEQMRKEITEEAIGNSILARLLMNPETLADYDDKKGGYCIELKKLKSEVKDQGYKLGDTDAIKLGGVNARTWRSEISKIKHELAREGIKVDMIQERKVSYVLVNKGVLV